MKNSLLGRQSECVGKRRASASAADIASSPCDGGRREKGDGRAGERDDAEKELVGGDDERVELVGDGNYQEAEQSSVLHVFYLEVIVFIGFH